MSEFVAPSVRQLLDDGAKRFGTTPFIKYLDGDKIIEKSYIQVRTDSLAVCRRLRSFSRDKKHIALIAKTDYNYITFLTGVLISGNVALPFAPDVAPKEAASLLERADVDVVLYGDNYRENIDELKSLCPKVELFENIDEAAETIYSAYGNHSEYADLSEFDSDVNELAAIIYTSGTTGVKKGVMLSMAALTGNIMYKDFMTDVFRENDVALSVLPMHHVFCFTGDYLKNLKDGLQVCLCPDTRNLEKCLQVFEPRVMRCVPVMADFLLRRIKMTELRNPDLSPRQCAQKVLGRYLKYLISGGAYLDPSLIEGFDEYGIFLRQGYGMTEAGCRISVPDNAAARSSVGRLIDVCEGRIQNGEIQIKSPTVMMGYYKMPQETDEMFTPDGWLKTGDIGVLTDDRQLFITGRVKNLIILSNGENVSPEAIEKKFDSCPLVKDVMVYGEDDTIVAEFFPDYNSEISDGDIRRTLEQLVTEMNATAKASHIISSIKIRTTPFERTASGKLKRKGNKV